jgi:molybdate transport repressor ModE-like protein
MADMADPGPDAYVPVTKMASRVMLKIFFVSLDGDKTFCGPGMIKLLSAIKQTGNVRDACENMGMSYSKGWKLLKGMETWLGFPAAVRHQGGKGGGEAYLTEDAQVFLEKYHAFEQECQKTVKDIFQHHFYSGPFFTGGMV